MKRLFVVLVNIFILIYNCKSQEIIINKSYSEIDNEEIRNCNNKEYRTSSIINSFDSVVFDVAQAVITGNVIEFPVSILSDDTIYALDFSFQYDQTRLVFDSIYNIAGYIQGFSYYNTTDSTIRYTSSSIQQYVNDTALVMVRFTMLTGSFLNSDLNSIKGYLNGDACSIKMTTSLLARLSEESEFEKSIRVYPVPSVDVLTIEADDVRMIKLIDLNGKVVLSQQIESGNNKIFLETKNISEGIYYLRVLISGELIARKIIINKD